MNNTSNLIEEENKEASNLDNPLSNDENYVEMISLQNREPTLSQNKEYKEENLYNDENLTSNVIKHDVDIIDGNDKDFIMNDYNMGDMKYEKIYHDDSNEVGYMDDVDHTPPEADLPEERVDTVIEHGNEIPSEHEDTNFSSHPIIEICTPSLDHPEDNQSPKMEKTYEEKIQMTPELKKEENATPKATNEIPLNETTASNKTNGHTNGHNDMKKEYLETPQSPDSSTHSMKELIQYLKELKQQNEEMKYFLQKFHSPLNDEHFMQIQQKTNEFGTELEQMKKNQYAIYDFVRELKEENIALKKELHDVRDVSEQMINQTKEMTSPIIDWTKKQEQLYEENFQALSESLNTIRNQISEFDNELKNRHGAIKDLYTRSNQLISAKKYYDALTLLNVAVEIDPNGQAYYKRGLLYLKMKEWTNAVRDFNKAIDLGLDHFLAFYNRGRAFEEMGDNVNALNDFSKTIELEPSHALAFANRGNVFLKLNRLEEALDDLNHAIELDDKLSQAFISRGSIFVEMGEVDKAIDDLSNGLSLDPENRAGYLLRGKLYEQIGDLEHALKDYSTVMDLDNNQVMKYINKKNEEEEDEEVEDSDEISSTPLPPKEVQNELQDDLTELDVKIHLITKEIKQQPKNASNYVNRAKLRIEQGKYEDAIADCDKAISIDTYYSEAYEVRSKAHDLLGQTTLMEIDKQLSEVLRKIEQEKAENAERERIRQIEEAERLWREEIERKEFEEFQARYATESQIRKEDLKKINEKLLNLEMEEKELQERIEKRKQNELKRLQMYENQSK